MRSYFWRNYGIFCNDSRYYLAEPGALIGFAGPRVIRETIGKDLPEGFQTSEFLQEKGFVDFIVKRTEIKETVSNTLKLLMNK